MTDRDDAAAPVDLDVTIDHLKVTRPPPKMPPKIAGALVKATREAEAVKKNKSVGKGDDKFGYAYAGADALMTEARDALASAGLAIVLTGWHVETVDRRDWTYDGSGERREEPPYTEREVKWLERVVVAAFTLVHEEGDTFDLQPFSMPSIPDRSRPADKADAAALTFATGYVMRGLLNLPRIGKTDDVDARDDSEHAPKGQRRGPTAEEKREADRKVALDSIVDALSTVTDLASWVASYGAKANRAVGMEALREVIGKRVLDLKADEGPILAELAKVVAASKKRDA